MIETKRVHIVYSGSVHGVGFRFTVCSLAEKFNLCGWVSNRADSKVELVVEGKKDIIVDFLTALESRMADYIQNKEVEWTNSKSEFRSFDIRY